MEGENRGGRMVRREAESFLRRRPRHLRVAEKHLQSPPPLRRIFKRLATPLQRSYSSKDKRAASRIKPFGAIRFAGFPQVYKTKKARTMSAPFCLPPILSEPEAGEYEVQQRAYREHRGSADFRPLGRGEVHSGVHGHFDVLFERLYECERRHYAERAREGDCHSVQEGDIAELPLQEAVDYGARQYADCAREARSPLGEHAEDEYRQNARREVSLKFLYDCLLYTSDAADE